LRTIERKESIRAKLFAIAAVVLAVNFAVLADTPVVVRHIDNQGELSDTNFQLSSQQRTIPMHNHNTIINLNPGSGISGNTSALGAFERAAQTWQGYFGDSVELNIDIDLASLGAGVLGSSSSTAYYTGFDTVRDMMVSGADTGSTAETATLSYLPTGAQYSAYVPSGSSLSGHMKATRANFLALGVSQSQLGGFGTSDASITFSTNYSWDYDNSDGITTGAYCFESVATHEIGHALGFVSEVDYADYLVEQEMTDSLRPMPLDLFRFSSGDVPTSSSEFTNNIRDLAPSGTDYFSYIDGDIQMSTGGYNGDGSQASHWKDNLGIGIMDPTLASGEISHITSADLIAMDLIGWQTVPEPATICLFGLGGLLLCRRKRN